MNAQPQSNAMNQAIERELARRIDRAQAEHTHAEIEVAGTRYHLVPVDDDIQMTDDPAQHYDPQKMRDAIHAVAGTMKGVKRDELFADLRAERGQDSSGRPAD